MLFLTFRFAHGPPPPGPTTGPLARGSAVVLGVGCNPPLVSFWEQLLVLWLLLDHLHTGNVV